MGRLDVQIPAPHGHSRGTLHVPDGDGPWPGVLVFPDAGGARETFSEMGDRLAGLGYVVLVPDIYYRSGAWAPFDVATLFTDPPAGRISNHASPAGTGHVVVFGSLTIGLRSPGDAVAACWRSSGDGWAWPPRD